MTTTQIPTPIQNFIDTTNAGDSAAFVANFTPDAVLTDWGTVYAGTDRIAAWNQSDNIGRKSQFTLIAATENTPDHWTVQLRVSGQGFNGESPFNFVVAGDQLASVAILPD